MNAWEAKRRAQLPEWRERIIKCRSSGLSVGEWCAGQGLSPKTYYRWEREILGLAGKQLACQETMPQDLAAPVFAELPMPKQMAFSGTAEATIHKGSVTVEIHSGASAEVISAIFRSLNHAE